MMNYKQALDRLREWGDMHGGAMFTEEDADAIDAAREALQERVLKRTLWIGVEVFQLIVSDVHTFNSFEQARAWFKKYTGVSYDVDEKGELPDLFYERLGEDYDQTKLFSVEV